MNRLSNNAIVRNRYGLVRSGWIILVVMLLFYAIQLAVRSSLIAILNQALIATGNVNPVTGYSSELVHWLDDGALLIALQIVMELLMIAVPAAVWSVCMKNPLREMGLQRGNAGRKEGLTGMVLGAVNCSVIYIIVITVGGGRMTAGPGVSLAAGSGISLTAGPGVSMPTVCWLVVFIMVAFAEEILNRGFLMATLRRCGNSYMVLLVPSVVFGLIHLGNRGVTLMSVLNIILAGLLFSYMFYKSGNLRMCIGYHFTWNTFQGVVFGMPVSGLKIPGIFTTEYSGESILNGGSFGLEGGVLTTAGIAVTLLLVWYYYRNSNYNFMNDTIDRRILGRRLA